MADIKVRKPDRQKLVLALLVLIVAILTFAALISPLLVQVLSPGVEIGQVATQDVLAPESVSYPSEVLTEQKREAAARAVLPVFTPPDTRVARQQVEKLRAALAYIASVRKDEYASVKQKLDDLAALEDIQLSQETASAILALGDARWQTVQQEAIVVLEQVMRTTIRDDRVEDARNTVPALVSLSLPESQAEIVAELASAFVSPNSLYSPELTEAARERARESTEPVVRSFVAGETVVSRGSVLTAEDIEALQELGLVTPQENWQDLTSAAAMALLMMAFVIFYLHHQQVQTYDVRSLVLIAILFLTFLFGVRLTIPGHTIIPYAFPIAAFGLTVAALFGAELAMIFSLPMAILAAYGIPNALELTLYYAISSLVGILILGRAQRLTSFFWAGLAVATSGAMIVLIYRLPQPTSDWMGITTLVGSAAFYGLAAASLTILLQFLLAQFLGMATPLQLMELTRPDHPLLQIILREAPGTYQHSLQVANLAEQAAERIGADTLLTRVGALYHDAGKSVNPVFFIENQMPGFLNPHDDLDPVTSAGTIIRHVTDGLEIARKHKLPQRILDFISEHHGTMLTRYQYVSAVRAAGGDESRVDMEQFRYPGPRPQSRETAILMLADGCEARVRAEKPKDEVELRNLIKSVIDNRIEIGELDDTSLTLHDLDQIGASFYATLRGVYHPRVPYPKLDSARAEAPTIPVMPPTSHQTSDVPVGATADRADPL